MGENDRMRNALKQQAAVPAGGTTHLFWPAGGVNTSQTGSVQVSAVVQARADEVSGAVGGGAHQHTTAGDAVMHLRTHTHNLTSRQTHHNTQFILQTVLRD